MRIQVSARSIYELGQRTNQEDFIYPPGSEMPSKSDLYILCDGMGGHEKGEVASETVCRTMSTYIKNHPREDGLFDETDFQKALDAAYDALDAKDTSAEKKMGTTLTLAKFHAGGCFIAHIGDSRIYHIRPATRTVLHVTRDHSLVSDLVQLGELTPEQAQHSRQKNIITRAMQPHQGRRDPADCCNLTDLQAGDYIYMCSDGMLEISRDADIVEILSKDAPDSEKIEVLRQLTRNNRDNHSAFLVLLVSVDPSGKKAAPAPAPASAPRPEPAPKPNPEPEQEPQPAKKSRLAYWIVGLVILAAVAAYWWLNHK